MSSDWQIQGNKKQTKIKMENHFFEENSDVKRDEDFQQIS